jgi:uncharacterized protein YdbL (DUF1318 family)
MKKLAGIIVCCVIMLGCARVRVEAPKDPIKVDISMRLDIYQHVEKDIDAIENIVSGAKDAAQPAKKQGSFNWLMSCAYAQDALSPEVEQAALRRKDRYQEVVSLEAQGVIGENRSGLLEVRGQGGSAAALAQAENSDRMIIYNSVAQKNGTSVAEVQKLYAKRLQQDAPAGTPVETDAGWKIK